MLLRSLLFLTCFYLILAQCPSGQFRNTTSTLCENCPAGTYSQTGGNGVSTCLLCPSGKFSYAGKNCTTCVGGPCLVAGAPEVLQVSDTILKNIPPFKDWNIQSLKVGFVFIPLLLFLFPLIVAAFTCWTEEVFRMFDIFENFHLIADGAPRVKKRTGLGGCCFLLAGALFSMALGAALVDFYFDNSRLDAKLSISPDSTKTSPFGAHSYAATIKLHGIEKEFCYATHSSTGYNVLVNGTTDFKCLHTSKKVLDADKKETNNTLTTCTCTYSCNRCSLNPTQNIVITLPSQKVFTSAIFFTYETPFVVGNHKLDGVILPPKDEVFYGTAAPTKVDITHFNSVFFGLLGGKHASGLAQFVNTFANLQLDAVLGVTTQVDLITKGASTTTLTGTGGVSVNIAGSFSKFDYVVNEYLSQTFLAHIGELVGVYLLILAGCFVLLIICEYILQTIERNEETLKKIYKLLWTPYNLAVKFIKEKIFKQEVKDESSSSEDEAEELEKDEQIDLFKATSEIAQLQEAVKVLTAKLAMVEGEIKKDSAAPKVEIEVSEKMESKHEIIFDEPEPKVGEVSEEILIK